MFGAARQLDRVRPAEHLSHQAPVRRGFFCICQKSYARNFQQALAGFVFSDNSFEHGLGGGIRPGADTHAVKHISLKLLVRADHNA